MIDSMYFDSLEEANAYADAREAEGHPYVCVLTNDPRPGSWHVRWGTLRETWTLTDLLCSYKRIFDEREQYARDRYEQRCVSYGRKAAGEAAAAAAGLSGRDATFFIDGFTGVPAKVANPRAEGREAVFRAGRRAFATSQGQRAARAAAAAARSIIPYEEPVPLRESGLIANGEY